MAIPLQTAVGVVWPGREWAFPPRRFEIDTGLTGIRGGYIMPAWLEVGLYSLFGDNNEVFSSIWDSIRQINPGLPESPTPIKHWVCGVLSDINLDDIIHFTSPSFDSDIGHARGTLIEGMTGTRPHWQISAKTERKIRKLWQAQTNAMLRRPAREAAE